MEVRTIRMDIGDKPNAGDGVSAKHAQRVCPLPKNASILGRMSDERRSTRRALLSGVHATYESATGERHQVLVSDLSTHGLFLQTESLLAVGKRLSLEISVTGEPAPWAALGRVVWARSTSDPSGLPGMGVKLIDVEDNVAAAIARFVASRGLATPAPGAIPAPSREKTMLGVGLAQPPAAPRLAREKTVLGVAPPPEASIPKPSSAYRTPARSQEGSALEPAPAREASLTIDLVARREPSDAIDLVAKKTPVPVPVTEEPYGAPSRLPSEESGPPLDEEENLPPLPKRRTGWVLLVFLIVLAAAIVTYVFHDRLRQRFPRLRFAMATCGELFACEATWEPRQGPSWKVGHDETRSEDPQASSEG
jgi:Tfp pilus assembly protein PilZ